VEETADGWFAQGMLASTDVELVPPTAPDGR
jgi:hypothetical protein